MFGVSAVRLAMTCLAAGIAFLIYILASGLDTTGRHLFVISLARLGFLAGLLGAVATLRLTTGLARVGLGLALVGAAFNVVAAVSHVMTDGWSYNPFEDDGADAPWYAYVIGITGILFGIGTVLVGIAAVRARVQRALAIAVLFGGIVVVLALALGAIGHAIWTLPWLAVGILTLRVQRVSTGRIP